MKNRQLVKCTEVNFFIDYISKQEVVHTKFCLLREPGREYNTLIAHRLINESIFVEMSEQEYEVFKEQFDYESN